QARHDAVLGEPRADLGLERGDDALEPLAVELDDRRRERVRGLARRRVGQRGGLLRQRLDPGDQLLLGGALRDRQLSTSWWGCGRPCGPCPCRTCARRRAGTGRTSGPPA